MKDLLKDYVIQEWVNMGLTPQMVKDAAKKCADMKTLASTTTGIAQEGLKFITQTAPVLSFMVPASIAAAAYYLTHQTIKNENIAKERKKIFSRLKDELTLEELIEDQKREESGRMVS